MSAIVSWIYPSGHFTLALAEWWLLGWAIRLWLRSNSLAMIVLPIVLVSLSYDNLVLALGSSIGTGELLKKLSEARFYLHDLVIPLFIIIGIELAHRAGAIWANRITRVLSWFLALGLAAIGLVNNYTGLDLIPVTFAGVLRYTIETVNGPPLITIGVNLFVLAIGIGLRFRLQWRWLFVGTAIALIGNAIPSSLVGTLPGSASEFILAFCLLLTERRTQFAGTRSVPDERSGSVLSSLS